MKSYKFLVQITVPSGSGWCESGPDDPYSSRVVFQGRLRAIATDLVRQTIWRPTDELTVDVVEEEVRGDDEDPPQ